MIDISNTTISYGERNIYEDFSLRIEDGETTVILGRSGVGKTTLLRYIAGLIGDSVPPHDVAYVFQEDRLVKTLSVVDNLRFVSIEDALIYPALARVGLEKVADAKAHTLSGGERARVNLLRGILTDRDIVLLDEPFSSIDTGLKVSLARYVAEVTRGRTVVMVTHDIEEALMLADRIVVLGDSRILYDERLPSTTPREYGDRQVDGERRALISLMLGEGEK